MDILEHTADAGIAATGSTLEQCFARAAAGLFTLLFDAPPPGVPRVTVEVGVGPLEGAEELLVAWLEELLYRSESERLAFHRFDVARVTADRVTGSATGCRFDALPELRGSIVKGVTRHRLEVAQRQGRWVSRVYFDV